MSLSLELRIYLVWGNENKLVSVKVLIFTEPNILPAFPLNAEFSSQSQNEFFEGTESACSNGQALLINEISLASHTLYGDNSGIKYSLLSPYRPSLAINYYLPLSCSIICYFWLWDVYLFYITASIQQGFASNQSLFDHFDWFL